MIHRLVLHCTLYTNIFPNSGIYLDDKNRISTAAKGQQRGIMEKRVRRYWRKVLAFVSCMIFVASGVISIQAAEMCREIPLEWRVACQGENSLADRVYQENALAGSALAGNARLDTEKEKNSTNLQLYAQSAVLMDADSGRILFGKNEKEQMPMASTTKIMTCILALENGNMDED